MTSISVKTPYYSPWFSAKNGRNQFWLKRIPYERAPQEEHNGANFSFIALSIEK